MKFADIIGQEDVKQHLRLAADQGRVPHAMLFTGIEGSGTLPLAIAFAQYLLCHHHIDGDSCGTCPSCLKFEKLAHPDLHFAFPIVRTSTSTVCDTLLPQFRESVLADPYISSTQWLDTISDSKQGTIYANESDEILRKLMLKSFEGDLKILILWQPEKMHPTGANKLLKLIEEPPAGTILLLVSNDPEHVLGTIVSRTQRIQLPPVSVDSMSEMLRGRYPTLTEEEVRFASRLARGSVNTAREIAETNESSRRYFDDFAFLMRTAWGIRYFKTQEKKAQALLQLRQFAETIGKTSRDNQQAFLSYAQRLLRENFIYNLQEQRLRYLASFEQEFSSKFSPYIHESNVLGIMQCFSDAQRDIAQNVQSPLVFCDLGLRLILLLKPE